MNKKTLLWRIELEGAPGLSFLFGTMHVQDQQAFAFLDQACRKIDDCEALALEFDLSDIPSGKAAELAQLPDGKTLSQLLSPRKFHKLRKFLLRACGIDLLALNHLSPVVATNFIAAQLLSQDMPVALDEHLWQYAKKTDKPTIGIETYEEQLHILQTIPLQQQLQALLKLGRNLPAYRASIKRMAALYATGDVYRIYQAAKRSAGGSRKTLLYARNIIMTERILVHAGERPVFFAIGAGHLAGSKGVLRLLKHSGARVSPVSI